MSYLLCGHCYRRATVDLIMKRTWWRALLHLPRARRQICQDCLSRYCQGELW